MIHYLLSLSSLIFSSVPCFILTDVYSMFICIILRWRGIVHSEDSFKIIFLMIAPLCIIMNLLPMSRKESTA